MMTTVQLGHNYPASDKAVAYLLNLPVTTPDRDTRSGWKWVRLINGDLILGFYPQGDEGYFGSELAVEQDYADAVKDEAVEQIQATGDDVVYVNGGPINADPIIFKAGDLGYVVDQIGSTFIFVDEADATEFYWREYGNADELTSFRTRIPRDMTGQEAADYATSHGADAPWAPAPSTMPPEQAYNIIADANPDRIIEGRIIIEDRRGEVGGELTYKNRTKFEATVQSLHEQAVK